jgi:hypothetical protein
MKGFERLMARIDEDAARMLARMVMPHTFAAVNHLALATERLTAYGQGQGLTKEEAREVVDTWSRETTLSITYHEDVFRMLLVWRVRGRAWEPAAFAPEPDVRARALVIACEAGMVQL